MRTDEPRALFSMLDGYRPVRNLLGAGDPNVHWVDGRWTMYVGGFQRDFRNNLFSATLPPGAGLDDGAEWEITTDPARPAKALPLVRQPSRGFWDHHGLHEPCRVLGARPTPHGGQAPCERIYYTGRGSRRVQGNDAPFAIGLLERTASGWRRHPEPVVVGDTRNPSALGPKVVYADGRWRMWFRATPGEPAKGEAPVSAIHYTESEDGVGGWSEPRVFRPVEEGFAHAYVRAGASRYEMLLSTSPNLHGENHYPEQGLWLSVSETPSGDPGDWTPPEPVLRAKEGPSWLRNGFFGSSLCAEHDPGRSGVRHVFFTGINESAGWSALALRRIASLERPPVPAPFHFTIGHMRIDLER